MFIYVCLYVCVCCGCQRNQFSVKCMCVEYTFIGVQFSIVRMHLSKYAISLKWITIHCSQIERFWTEPLVKLVKTFLFFPLSLSPSTSSRYRWIQCSRWWITFHFPMKLQSNPTIVDFGKMKMLLLNATACAHTKNFVQHTLANWFQLQMIGENPSHRCNSLIYILKMNFCQWSFIRMKCIGIWNTH